MTLNYKDQCDFDFKLDKVRESIANAEIDKGIVNIKGKKYSTVGSFRSHLFFKESNDLFYLICFLWFSWSKSIVIIKCS